MIRVDNTPRDYAWGSTTDIAIFQGRKPSGKPEAELWLGTHPGSPTRITEPEKAGGARTIAEFIDARGEAPLPYLLKLLAAAHPLSIQAHPSMAQAQAGFDKENEQGIPLDAPHRNYKDPLHKPELIVALSPVFEALCGLRKVEETTSELHKLANEIKASGFAAEAIDLFTYQLSEKGLEWAIQWALTGKNASALVQEISEAAVLAGDELLVELSRDYPGDPGIVVALLLNRVTLRRGEALYLPAGNLHAYIRGFGVELMAASDNVLRGGLTTKHVDVPELLSVISRDVVPVPRMIAESVAPGVELFLPDVPDFALAHITSDATIKLTRHAIAVCTSGEMTITGKNDLLSLKQGQSVFITDDEKEISVTGYGELFVAF